MEPRNGSELSAEKKNYLIGTFSAHDFCDDTQRKLLEEKYAPILEPTDRFNRQSVSFQLSKDTALHSWLSFKEGFSANLVNTCLDDMGIQPGDTILDPFLGSGTTALVCRMRGINSVGYDILPTSSVAVRAKADVFRYDQAELERLIKDYGCLELPDGYTRTTPSVTITRSAYPEDNAKMIQYSTEWIENSGYSGEAKNLFQLCVLNCLERCSYTAKTGQYLSWDSRSEKIIQANRERVEREEKPLPEHHCREEIADIKTSVLEELRRILNDIREIQGKGSLKTDAKIEFTQGSVLFHLPEMPDQSADGVITSPPYCNRYDYTRTYALELVYLGANEDTIKEMRQDLLSCTVENRPKLYALKAYYDSIGQTDRFNSICETIQSNAAFREVLDALRKRRENKDLNNSGIIRMVEGYFTEMAFLIAELYRVCKDQAMIVMVNDNVRYAGEIIPVDFLLTNFAERFGFVPVKVYCLKQRKGNSSQQMQKFGKAPLRKSIIVWRKK